MAVDPVEQLHAVFIEVDVDDDAARDPELAAKLAEVCPVDIYAVDEEAEAVKINRENLDECVLCELCVKAAPPGAVVVRKLYDGSELRR
jgi:NAD-dependent dihydropyrimidine dehydrogenase PreA subunit